MWAYDFIFDTCADGRSLKCLTVVDEFTRECLAIDVAGSIRSGRVIDILGQLVSRHGAECLSLEWFRNRTEAKIGIERWRRHYNEERPHMSLGDLTPAEFKAQMGTTHGWVAESPMGVILTSGPKKPGMSVVFVAIWSLS